MSACNRLLIIELCLILYELLVTLLTCMVWIRLYIGAFMFVLILFLIWQSPANIITQKYATRKAIFRACNSTNCKYLCEYMKQNVKDFGSASCIFVFKYIGILQHHILIIYPSGQRSYVSTYPICSQRAAKALVSNSQSIYFIYICIHITLTANRSMWIFLFTLRVRQLWMAIHALNGSQCCLTFNKSCTKQTHESV